MKEVEPLSCFSFPRTHGDSPQKRKDICKIEGVPTPDVYEGLVKWDRRKSASEGPGKEK